MKKPRPSFVSFGFREGQPLTLSDVSLEGARGASLKWDKTSDKEASLSRFAPCGPHAGADSDFSGSLSRQFGE